MVLSDLFEKHAPLRKQIITDRPCNPWYNVEIKEAKQYRKRLERRCRNTNLIVDRKRFEEQRLKVINLTDHAKCSYYSNKIDECQDQQGLFKIVEDLSQNKGSAKLPMYNDSAKLAETFSEFFTTKNAKIRDHLDADKYLQSELSRRCGCS